MPKRVVIMGAAGRDFHNFNVFFRGDENYTVVGFTAAQVPNIAGRVYPPSLAGRYYPQGIPIVSEQELPRLIRESRVDVVVLAYSDLNHAEVMHKASKVLAGGADFMLLGPNSTMLDSRLPVVAVTATRTGAGKSTVTRYLAALLRRAGKLAVIIRHPMPYGNLAMQEAQRFANLDDLDRYSCTLEEREEYEPHLEAGYIVYAGVDYQKILRLAEEEAEILLWDGGNNDFPFIRPAVSITIADAHRPGDETGYYPGETNLMAADVVVINKAGTAPAGNVDAIKKTVASVNPGARVMVTGSKIFGEKLEGLRGRKVAVVEDAPTVTHGGMSYSIGYLAAMGAGAEVIDPRPYAVGSLKEIYRQYPHLGLVVPSLGYGPEQLRDLQTTLDGMPCDAIVSGTPIDLGRTVKTDKPVHRVRYELDDYGQTAILDVLKGRSLLP